MPTGLPAGRPVTTVLTRAPLPAPFAKEQRVSTTIERRPTPPAGLAEAGTSELEAALIRHPGDHRVLTGDRPTGPLHLGHYFGTLANRVRLQNLGVDVLVLVADYQTIIDRASPASLPGDVEQLIADYLAVGVDPAQATIFAHSQVPALNQLMLPLLSLVSVAELSRNPTVKEEVAAAGIDAMSGLMFSYPVHQAADILCCRATVVPVGRDQLPHVELTRSLARRFNRRYCDPGAPLFALPEALLGPAPALLGADGQKMSKSRHNAIAIGASADETAKLIAGTRTDSQRLITYDPAARPEVSNLVLLAALCLDRAPEQIAAAVGDAGSAALKRLVTDAVNERFAAIRARRAELVEDPAYLREVLRAGSARVRELADETLALVHERIHAVYR
jgi:tryptophanyl-tRNA synthetase